MKVAIVGYGVEGKASYKYWSVEGNEVTIVDEHESIDDLPSGVQTILGGDAFSKLQDFDLIIRSPSVHPDKLPYADKVWSATNEFFAKCPAPIIGVTGTKGKGTTCSLITSVLKAAGRNVYLVGNIGVPGLEILPKIQPSDVVVYELSSFQLWDIGRSPHVAVVLGIEPDHLDVHSNMADYVAAKANIAKHQVADDVVIFNRNNSLSRQIGESSLGRKVEYPFDISALESSLVIPGKHNIENASAAIAAAREFKVDDEAIKHGLSNFTGLPHRLKFVAEKRGVKFYDDSIATTPGSAIAAINSFDEPKILLLGGYDKGADYEELIEKCKQKDVTIIAYGSNRNRLKALSDKVGAHCDENAGTMEGVVASAVAQAQPGSVVILSPAAASFDMFKNYADRGDQFIAAVEKL